MACRRERVTEKKERERGRERRRERERGRGRVERQDWQALTNSGDKKETSLPGNALSWS